MEVVLLWLDDLDDLVFCAAAAWESLRRVCLQVGLAAAFALAGCESWMIALEWVPTLAGVAGASVAIWFLGATLVALFRMASRFAPAAA